MAAERRTDATQLEVEHEGPCVSFACPSRDDLQTVQVQEYGVRTRQCVAIVASSAVGTRRSMKARRDGAETQTRRATVTHNQLRQSSERTSPCDCTARSSHLTPSPVSLPLCMRAKRLESDWRLHRRKNRASQRATSVTN